MNLEIAIVILNWNGKKLLEQFLPSVVKCSDRASIYVADNASSDDSISFIKSKYPKVNIILNDRNGGYAGGYNDALKDIDADIFCLLNNDVEVTPNWLNPIVEAFEVDSKTVIVQPKILDLKNKLYFEYAGAAGGFLDKYGYAFCRGRMFDTIEKDEGQYDKACQIFWASGACLFIRAKTFNELEGFDESYFAHFEEIDLCWRAFNRDLKSIYIPNSTIYHLGGASLNKLNPKKTYLNFRNSLFALTKNSNGVLFGKVFTRLCLDGIAAVRFLFQFEISHFFAIIRAHLSYYLHLPKLLSKRSKLQKRSDYFQITSIVWSYFIKKKQKYTEL